MPELPEVETIRRGLSQFILKARLQKIEVRCQKSFIGVFRAGKVTRIRRFGKALVIDMDNAESLLIHLRMTGQLIFDPKIDSVAENQLSRRYAAGHPSENFVSQLPNQQTRVILEFNNGTLYFNDQRKFGFIKIVPTTEIEQDSFIRKLAKEPWEMTTDEFYKKLSHHPNSAIKATILDQTIICGLGNIYADESLFVSHIHPLRKSGSLTRDEAERLLIAARQVMEASIASGGSTMATYVKADGTKGDYLEQFAKVFRREGKPCPACGHIIVKIKAAGRGTHLCPHCQRI